MSYLVLARKWRPQRFEELVGQEHVVRALSNGLDTDRVHHAFLFTGTRGVGKTTIARLLAKALNCDKGVSSTPCGQCGTCKEVEEGRFVDLIEVDAASRTKVEDTRELLENVQYAPTRGRYKVYLIDEVHMLSGHSFNALLKTLEEPPPHVKFLLATTDPQKLPITVVSRCLQFHLKRLTPPLIVARIQHILKTEGIEFEEQACELLAQAADGSLRDALSLLDQALVYGAGRVLEADVRRMLGTIDRAQVLGLLQALAAADAAQLLSVIAAMDSQAPDYQQVLGECSEAVLRLTREQWVAGTGFMDYTDPAPWLALTTVVPTEELQLWYQIMLTGRRDLALAQSPRSGFEMTMLRCLAFKPTTDPSALGQGAKPNGAASKHAPIPSTSPELAAAPKSLMDVRQLTQAAQALRGHGGQALAVAPSASRAAAVDRAQASNDAQIESGDTPPRARLGLVANSAASVDVAWVMPHEWQDPLEFPLWLKSLPCAGAVATLLSHCALIEATASTLRLSLSAKGASFYSPERVSEIEALIGRKLNAPIRVSIEQAVDDSATPMLETGGSKVINTPAAVTLADKREQVALAQKTQAQQAFLTDPAVKSLRLKFQAEVKMDSVQPVKRSGGV
jgi:DNA polymerase III subunit gamma/tau